MKQLSLWLLSLLPLVWVVVSCGTSSPTAPASAGREQPSCCVSNVEPSAVLSDRSLYQLDSPWTDDLGRTVKLSRLRGHVQVVALFFTHCTYACPIIVHDMRRIEEALPKAVRAEVGFTLVTIDTERDTPDVLHDYRKTRRLPADRWTLLRGTADDTLELAALLGVKFKREVTGQFAHSNLITVLNSEGEIVHQLVGLNQDIHETVKAVTQSQSVTR